MFLNRIALILPLIFLPLYAFPQGALLDDGESGGGFLAGTAVSSEGLFIQGGGLATIYGRLDLGGLVSGELFDKYNIGGTALGIWAELYVLRENWSKKIPLSLSVSYQVSGNSRLSVSTFGMSLYKRVGESKRSFVQPAVSIFYLMDDHYPRSNSWGFALGASVASRVGKYALFSFTPSFANVNDEKSVALTIGLLFSDARRSKEQPIETSEGNIKFDF